MVSRLRSPSTDFRAVRDGLNSGPFYFDIQLGTARNDFVLPISGNSFYIDANPNDGNAVCAFRNYDSKNADAEFYVSPGFIYRGGFTELRLSWTAQSGKKIRIVYGTDIDFQPGSVAQLTLAGAVQVTENSQFPFTYNAIPNAIGNIDLVLEGTIVQTPALAADSSYVLFTGSATNRTWIRRLKFTAQTAAGMRAKLYHSPLPYSGQARPLGFFDTRAGEPAVIEAENIMLPINHSLLFICNQALAANSWSYFQSGNVV